MDANDTTTGELFNAPAKPKRSDLTVRQQLALGDWARDHEADCRSKTYKELAEMAAIDPAVMFHVTESNMASVCRARYGNKRKESPPDPETNLAGAVGYLVGQVNRLNDRITALEDAHRGCA